MFFFPISSYIFTQFYVQIMTFRIGPENTQEHQKGSYTAILSKTVHHCTPKDQLP